jgi:hypothetical protein
VGIGEGEFVGQGIVDRGGVRGIEPPPARSSPIRRMN